MRSLMNSASTRAATMVPKAQSPKPKADVIVIGAGCAGLSAATALAEAGAQVLVLEARPGLGGRATAFRDPETGERVDNGQHIMMGCYDESLRFLDRINARDRVHVQSSLAVPMIDRHGHPTTLRLPPLPAPFHLLGGVFAWEALSWRERLSVLRLGRPLARRRLDGDLTREGLSVRNWLTTHGQAPRLIELLWEPLALAALNQSIDQAAAAPFMTVLSRMFGPESDRAALILPAVPLDEMYAEPARAWLEARGHDVRTRSPAHIRVDGHRAAGVTVRGERIDAPAVVSAVPWHALEALFDRGVPPAIADTVQQASAMASSPIVTVNLWYDRPVTEAAIVGLPGRRFQWVFDKRGDDPRAASRLSVVASGADDIAALTNEQAVSAARAEVESALPAARRARLRKGTAVRERRSTFSLAPGQPPRPGARTALEGFYLAGDWTDTGLPATIESAVMSGHAAARLVGQP
jgi:squalene-associated FAD-dependent desaturase